MASVIYLQILVSSNYIDETIYLDIYTYYNNYINI